jgi:hypothetical protein
MMSKKFPVNMRIHVNQRNIDEGKCGDPNHCMIKVAVKHAIGGHGYVNVDASGISITRRPDYREKAFMPRKVRELMLVFDKWGRGGRVGPCPVKPFSFKLTFVRTSSITKRDNGAVNAKRRERIATGWKQKKYDMRKRIAGIATSLRA